MTSTKGRRNLVRRLVPAFLAAGLHTAMAGEGGIELRVTLGTDPPPACGTATSLDVVAGEQVNWCFSVTNRTEETLTEHTLNDDQYQYEGYPYPGDPFFAYHNLGGSYEFGPIVGSVAPGGTLQYNVVTTAGADVAPRFVWGATAGEPDYTATTATAPFEDISAIGTHVVTQDMTFISPPPFPFTFYGLPNGHFDSDGYCIRMGGTLQPERHFGPCYLDAAPPFSGDNPYFEMDPPDGGNAMFGFWDALGDGDVYYAVLGDAPYRRLVVQWDRWSHTVYEGFPGWECPPPADADGITFQIILEESTGRVRYAYEDTTFGGAEACGWEQGASATVGLAGFGRTPKIYLSHNQAALADGLQITFTPMLHTHIAQAQARLNVGVPHLVVSPTALQASTTAGQTVERSLAIANGGDHPLAWMLHRAPAKAHFPVTPRNVPAVGDPTKTSSDALGDAALAARSAARAPQPPPGSPSGVFARAVDADAKGFGEGSVPAYATRRETGWVPYLGRVETVRNVSFDAQAPDVFAISGLGNTGYVHAGDFVGDDFTRQYVFGGAFPSSDFGLGTVDTATGQARFIGEARPTFIHQWEEKWQGLSWDRTTDTLYAASSMCESGPGPSALYTLDPGNAAMQVIGRIEADADICIGDIAVAPDGAMYGIDLTGDTLLAIDKTTGEAAVIGSVGFDLDNRNSIDFDDATGTLYLAAYTDFEGVHGGLHTLDLATGTASRIAPFPRALESWWMQVTGLGIARAGADCAYPGEIPWLSTDVDAGVAAPAGESLVAVTLSAVDLAPGRYEANLCVHSNDRARSLRAVPVTFEVTERGPAIFADGFDVSAP